MTPKTKLCTILLSILLVSSSACKKSDSNNDLELLGLILAYLNYQASGECAIVTRVSSGTNYTAVLRSHPRSACNAGAIYGNDRSTGAAIARQITYDGPARVMTALNATLCASAITFANSGSAAITTANFCALTTANVADCASDSTWSSTLEKTAFFPITSSIATGTVNANSQLSGYSSAQIANTRMVSYYLLENEPALAVILAHSAGNTACRDAIKSAYPFLNGLVGATVGVHDTGKTSSHPVLSVTTCGYGSAFAPTGTNGSCVGVSALF